MKVDKLTVVVHPYSQLKPFERSNLDYIPKTMRYRTLSKLPTTVTEDPLGQLKRVGFSEEEIQTWLGNHKKYKQGLEFASNGKVLILRAPRYDVYLGLEQELFQHAASVVPDENLMFFPRLDNTKYIVEKDLENLGLSEIKQIVEENAGEERDSIKDAQLFTFGEILGACIPSYVCGVHKLLNINRPFTVVGNFCEAESQEDAHKKVMKSWEHGDPNEFGYTSDQVKVEWL